MSCWGYSSGDSDSRLSEGTWEKLSQVAVKGAEYNSRERQPHPKCLQGTRVTLLGHIYALLDDRQGCRIIWLSGTAGVGKSSVAFNVADKMRGLKVTEERPDEKRLAGTFFFSRKYTNRCTTGYFFATLAYQLAGRFPSIRGDVNRAIRENPSLLDSNKSLHDQMEALFLNPLRRLQLRLNGCPPVVIVIDALDECASEAEITDLISLLAQALREPDIPLTHILLTSRSETHIREAIDDSEVCPLVCEIPVKISGEGVTSLISLDGADVDSDICIFLEHSFKKLRSRCPSFPQPTARDLERLASRAGRRFIVASTMMKFIDDEYSDPRDRLDLMLELTSKLLPGTEVFLLYDHILSTCADPMRAYLHLSVVAALANPLPISQISEFLGPGQGRDVERVLVQLRSIMDIPADSNLPITIHHSSVRDYALEPSNCILFKKQSTSLPPSPHSLLAYSSFRLMIHMIPESMNLLDAILKLKTHSRAMESHDPQSLMKSLAFIVEPLPPMEVLSTLVWLRGDHSPKLYPWLETMNGRAWLRTQAADIWLESPGGTDWSVTLAGTLWLMSPEGKKWGTEKQPSRRDYMRSLGLQMSDLEPLDDNKRLPNFQRMADQQSWLQSTDGIVWLRTTGGQHWLQTLSGQIWLQTSGGKEWLQTSDGWEWKNTQGIHKWLRTPEGREWLDTQIGREWLHSGIGARWLKTESSREWLQTQNARDWLQTQSGQDWLETPTALAWLKTPTAREWLETRSVQERLQSESGRVWLQTQGGREWLQTHSAQEWMKTPSAKKWLKTPGGRQWLQTLNAREWLQTPCAQEWLQTPSAREWLQTPGGRQWLQMPHGQAWQSTAPGSFWSHIEEFLHMVETIGQFVIIPELPPLQPFQVIKEFESLPDFLMFPAFLALNPGCPISTTAQAPDTELFRALSAFVELTNNAQKRSQSSSDALAYACQNWALHLSGAPNPLDSKLNRIFKVFWEDHLLAWLERHWCLRGLRSCLTVLSEGQKLAKNHLHVSESSQSSSVW